MSKSTLVSFASWEPRFVEGTKRLLQERDIELGVFFFSREYDARTKENRELARRAVEERKIPHEFVQTSLNTSADCWIPIANCLPRLVPERSHIVFDISTAPREPLWYILHALDALKCTVEWRYFRPERYGDGWLSRNALPPRLVLKRSGIALPGRKTCIVALAGFDAERLAQLIERFEPACCIVGRQIGQQLGNQSRNTGFDSSFIRNNEIEIFDFNCYDASDVALKLLQDRIPENVWNSFNVIGASLGPKPSAITMFRLSQVRSQLGLVYVPSGDYNIDYSEGIDVENVGFGSLSPTG